LARWLAARTPLAPNAGLEAKELEPDILATMRIAASFSRRAMQRFAGNRANSGVSPFLEGGKYVRSSEIRENPRRADAADKVDFPAPDRPAIKSPLPFLSSHPA